MIESLGIFHGSTWGTLLQIIGALASVIALLLSAFLALSRLELLPLTWRSALRAVKNLQRTIAKDNWTPDFIICMGRSGGIWGGFLAGNFGSKPAFMIMDKYAANGTYVEFDFVQQCVDVLRKTDPKRVLVVHGYSGTGGTFFHFRQTLENRRVLRGMEFRFASVFAWKGCRFTERHYVGRWLNRPPKTMPWHVSDSYVTAM